jgi:hypothetical protein
MRLKREIVRGTPIRLGNREIVPEAVIWSWQQANATLGSHQQAALQGGLFRWARPTALWDRAPERTYRVPVSDINHRLEVLLLIAAAWLPVVLNAAASLLRGAQLTRTAKE